MFGLLSFFGGIGTMLADHRWAFLAIAAAAVGVAARMYIPVAGAVIARICFALAIGLGCFDLGYSTRAADDRSAELLQQIAARDAQIAEQKRQALQSALIAADANERARIAEKTRDETSKKVDDYEAELAKRTGCDDTLNPADLRRLRELGPARTDPPEPPRRPR